MNEAAKQLFITQPSLSNAVKDLENEMGIEIFIRNPKGITLTRDGMEFLSYARQVVEQIAQGTAQRTPQDPAQVTYAPMLSRALSPIDWSQSAQSIHNKIRGLNPWPATSTDIFGGDAVKVFRSQVTGRTAKGTSGTILGGGNDGIEVLCGDGTALRILELQAPGARRMSAGDYLRGHPLA